MPSTVTSLFAAADVYPRGAVPWGSAVSPALRSGVYAISQNRDPGATTSTTLQTDPVELTKLLAARPALCLDGSRPTQIQLADRLVSLGILGEPILYVGLTTSTLHKRIGQFYRTRPGARSPHAGGWPLKYLSGLAECWVHVAECDNSAVKQAEFTMLTAFMSAVSPQARSAAVDQTLPLPYANLEIRDPYRRSCKRKQHGITGALA